MPAHNPFSDNAFKASQLSHDINIAPNKYGRLNAMNLMPIKGSRLKNIMIEEKNGTLSLLPSTQSLAPATLAIRAKRKRRPFQILRIVYEDHVDNSDVNAVLAFGSETQLRSKQDFVNERMLEMRSKHDQTLEWLRLGALKGKLVDGDGVTEIYDFFSEFGITQKSVDFKLGTTTTNILKICHDIKRHIEVNLMGESMSEIRVLVEPAFYDSFVSHANVIKTFEGWQAAQAHLGGDMRKGFSFGGVTFEEYNGTVTDSLGVAQSLITANEGIAFPLGTTNTFRTFVGPADFNETVNEFGRVYYAKIKETDFERGYDIHTQSNPLPICMRPAVLVRCHTSN